MPGIVCLILGIVADLIGIILVTIHFRDVISCKERISATISNLKVDKISLRGSSVLSYCPEFTYTVNEREYSGIATYTTYSKDKYKVGNEIEICYNINNPEHYRMKGKCKSLLFGLGIVAVGVFLTVLYFI